MNKVLYILIGMFMVSIAFAQTSSVDSDSLYQKGYNYFKTGQYEQALPLVKQSVAKNNADAQYLLGMMYLTGQGLDKNSKKAFEWMIKAANQDHQKAMSQVSWMYHDGIGVKQDQEKAINYYNKLKPEALACPVGDMYALHEHIKKTLKYPKKAKKLRIEGRVFVTFDIDTDGSVINIKVIRGIGGGCDEEAIRIMSLAPKWVPGSKNGELVKQQMTFSIIFSRP